MSKKIVLVSRCAWTLHNFRAGLMRRLKQSGWSVYGGGARGGGFARKIKAMGVTFNALPLDMKGVNPFRDLGFFLAMFFWYRELKPHVVHHFTIKPVIYGTVAARAAGAEKVVNTITGLGYVFTGARSTLLRRLVELMYKISLSFADYTFFPNQSDLDFFLSRRMVKPEKAGLLPGEGVDLDHFDPELFQGPDPDKPPMVLMVARLLKDKGIREFVEAAGMAKDNGLSAKFCLLGGRDEGNPTVIEKEVLNNWEEQGLIEWLGEVEDVRPLLARAAVVALPSYREGAPRSLLEASAMAKPVVATDVVGCRDVVFHEKNGLLVQVKDAKSLYNGIKRILDDPQLSERLGQEGRAIAAQKFSEEIVIDNILKIYDE